MRAQGGLDPGAVLVVRPKSIAKRLNHVIGRDAEVGVAVLDHLQNGLQHADDRAVRAVLTFRKPAQAVEVTEELVSAIDEVHDHFWSMLGLVTASLKGVVRVICQMGKRRDPA